MGHMGQICLRVLLCKKATIPLTNLISIFIGADDLEAIIEEFDNWKLETFPEEGTHYGYHQLDDTITQWTDEAFVEIKVNMPTHFSMPKNPYVYLYAQFVLSTYEEDASL